MAERKVVASSVVRRLNDASAAIMGDAEDDPGFLHVIMSQVGLPYREPKGRDYIRETGRASLVLTAGYLRNPATRKMVLQGLPYGAKARLIVLHLCTQAVRLQSPVVPVADSLTAYMRTLGIPATGGAKGSIARFKEQLNRLTAARMQFSMDYGNNRTTQFNPAPMVTRADLWFADDPRQRVLWPSQVRLSEEFFADLRERPLPVDPRAFGALAHSARALDLYTWLAHRLPRVKERAGAFIAWGALQKQFGADVADLRDFRSECLTALRQVLLVYPVAKVDQVHGGLRLFRSEPAIARRPSVRGSRSKD
ncbi:replication protein RepA [Paracraurococcus lichenis]|uniref:Replication protein RepA n=1 Tax=Paracraurococcus lichenis TaxID=3064888 RepID=A0ABT9ECY3_9PROT|nr:replication protein RepA [Paracraurococcus sp. LOR1-02]MDO9713885.1 replication protein RepA [Paracraurococcus sp. LOR1-02]